MKARKTKDLKKALTKKGFELFPEKKHHQFYFLVVNGKKQTVKTYFSHGKKEYAASLMGSIKKQLRFPDAESAERFFDCPMSGEEYVEMLREVGEIK